MLPNYQTILYASDMSKNVRGVFRHAVSFARTYKAKIYFVHVIPSSAFNARQHEYSFYGYHPDDEGQPRAEEENQNLTKGIAATIRQRLEIFAAEELPDDAEPLAYVAGIEVVVGSSPVVGILQASDRVNADLLVFGSHSKGVGKYTFLGHVAERVLRKSRRPSLIVPITE